MKKRFSFGWVLSVLIMSCVLTAGFEFAKGMVMSSVEAADSGLFGDIDSDGRITMKDAMIIAQYYNKNFVQFETVEWSDLIHSSVSGSDVTTVTETTETTRATTKTTASSTVATRASSSTVYLLRWGVTEIPITTVADSSGTTYTTPVPAKGNKIVTAGELDELCASVDLKLTAQHYVVQADTLWQKISHPDLLCGIVQNNSQDEIKNLVITYYAWDNNNLPVLFTNKWTKNAYYPNEVHYDGVNLLPGDTYGEYAGCEVQLGMEVTTFRAVVKSYDRFDGTTWENPYYDYFDKMYNGKKLTSNMCIEVPI